jgi:hypothetical protein
MHGTTEENNMNRYKIICFPVKPNGERTRKPISYFVELPTLQEAMNHADTVGTATKRDIIAIWRVTQEPPQIKGMIQWTRAACRNSKDGSWHISKQPNNTRTHTKTAGA